MRLLLLNSLRQGHSYRKRLIDLAPTVYLDSVSSPVMGLCELDYRTPPSSRLHQTFVTMRYVQMATAQHPRAQMHQSLSSSNVEQ